MANGNKKPIDVWGARNECPNFEQCPLCYGCRNYDSSVEKCYRNCYRNNAKINICNTEKHKSKLIAKFVPIRELKVE